ncbi:RraA family protein [Sphaerisporangium sp. TRM90804]|uniref:RraA family protein n=1 Tax=Sphaerisporangium sp. TRM90804 TaxID=3031113 RepID=UPI00244A4238|nr:RraA family protein [Sphaerisporangium sp. TRM90804]MDH2425470.1 RraA family protein [Sphaerisporangium sp. TRM90804]
MVPPTTAIADVLQLRGLSGWLSPPLRPIHPTMGLIGRARTVRLAPGPDDDLEPLRAVLDEDLRDRVLVLAGAQAAAGAVWGEILTRAALARHAAGLLVEGGVRDVNAFRDLGLPVWALYEATAGPGAAVRVASVGDPVEIAGVIVDEDTFIVMDGAGVVALPSTDVLDDSYAYAEAEEDVVTALREGATLAEAYRHKADTVAKLRRSASVRPAGEEDRGAP